MVYEDADAAMQLKGFYDEVASPLLSDIQLSYLDDQAFEITRSVFPNYFQGSELVVAGRVKPGVKDLKVSMSATDSKQRVRLENDVLVSHGKTNDTVDSVDCSGGLEGISSFVRRLWAYYTIKELLLAKLNTTDPAAQRLLADKATNLSLKYNFVTPVTSLVVVKPDTDEAAQTQTAAPTLTTTATTTATTKISAADVGKKLSSFSTSRPNKTKPDPPRPPQNTPQTKKRMVTSTKTVVSPSRKTPSSSIKKAQAPLSGKKPSHSQNDSKTDSPPPAGKISISLRNALKTAPAPAPGKVSTHQSNATKTTTPSDVTFTTTPPPRTRPTPLPGRPLTSLLSTAKTTLLPVKGTVPSTEAENSTTSVPNVAPPEITAALSELMPPPTSPTAAPAGEHNNSDSGVDTDLILVSATFAPMPGVTDGPRLWEAAGLLGRLDAPLAVIHT